MSLTTGPDFFGGVHSSCCLLEGLGWAGLGCAGLGCAVLCSELHCCLEGLSLLINETSLGIQLSVKHLGLLVPGV